MGAGCIVNPVRDGSGVQLKTLDMLQTDLKKFVKETFKKQMTWMNPRQIDELDVRILLTTNLRNIDNLDPKTAELAKENEDMMP